MYLSGARIRSPESEEIYVDTHLWDRKEMEATAEPRYCCTFFTADFPGKASMRTPRQRGVGEPHRNVGAHVGSLAKLLLRASTLNI